MPIDYSKFKGLEDSDEEPPIEAKDTMGNTRIIKGLSTKKLRALEDAADLLRLRKQPCYCFFDFSIKLEDVQKEQGQFEEQGACIPPSSWLGRVIVVLDQAHLAPRLTENFRSLCTGERGSGVGQQRLHYKGRALDAVMPRFCMQGSIPNEYSCWGRYLEDEALVLPSASFDRPGILAVGNHGPNTNSCTWMITLHEAEHLNGHNQIIGRVTQGMEVLRFIEQLPTDRSERSYAERDAKTWWGGKPLVAVTIADCGEISAHEAESKVPADGDKYPLQPLDFTCTGDPDKLMEAAKTLKEIGNTYVRNKDFDIALMKYRKAQSYLEPLLRDEQLGSYADEDPRTWLAGGVRPKDRTEAYRTHLTLALNECQVFLSLQQWEQAIASAEAVLLEMRGLHSKKGGTGLGPGMLPNDPFFVKALFRRARARLGLSETPGAVSQIEEAIEDLEQAKTLEPSSMEVQRELERARRRQRCADERGRHIYTDMFKAPPVR